MLEPDREIERPLARRQVVHWRHYQHPRKIAVDPVKRLLEMAERARRTRLGLTPPPPQRQTPQLPPDTPLDHPLQACLDRRKQQLARAAHARAPQDELSSKD